MPEEAPTTPDRWQQLKPLFGRALELPPEDRAQFVSESCGADADLRRELEKLLDAHAGAGTFLENSPVAADDCAAPAAIGPYSIVRELGRGGMGAVYLTEDSRLGRQVALKILPLAFASDGERIRQLEDEALAASALNHPNIVTIYELGCAAGMPYIATEFIDGETLRQRLKRGPIPAGLALDMAIQVARALAAAHAAGITHRDIKPENIMLRRDGYVKVLDFGIAKARGAADVASGILMGTPAYMAPEQARGVEVDARADIYSFGVVLREMMEPGYRRRGLGRIISRATRADPSERYQSAQELIRDLERVRRGRWRFAWELAAAVIVAVMLLVFHVGRRSAPDAIRMSRISASGDIKDVAISPDGRYLAYAGQDLRLRDLANGEEVAIPPEAPGRLRRFAMSPDSRLLAYGNSDLRIRELGTGKETTIIARGIAPIYDIAFSADSRYVFYTAGYETNDLWRFPVTGGRAKSIARNIRRVFHVSPDGRHIAFVREDYPAPGQSGLIAVDMDGREQQLQVVRERFKSFIWSPDGDAVICAIEHSNGIRLLALPARGGPPRPIGSTLWNDVDRFQWRDRSSLLFAATDASSGWLMPLWSLKYPEGIVRRVIADVGSYESVSAGSDRIAALKKESSAEISVAGEANSFRADGAGVFFDVAWTQDGRLLYFSDATGTMEIWVSDPDGSNRRQLTRNAGLNALASACGGGHHIVFTSNRTGEFRLWRMDRDGANPVPLTGGALEGDCSSDGRWVVYTDGAGTWRVPSEGGTPQRLTLARLWEPMFSPDGRFVAGERNGHVEVYPSEGGPILYSLDSPNSFGRRGKWSPDGSSIDYIGRGEHDGGDNIWRRPLTGGDPVRITEFRSGNISAFAWSPDGKRLALARISNSRDVVLITGFH